MSKHVYLLVILAAAALMGLAFSACAHAEATPSASDDAERLLSDGDVPGAAVEMSLPFDAADAAQLPDEAGKEIGDSFTGPEIPERERADDAFFADAAFFGNSLMEGLGGFGGLQSGAFFAHTSAALYNLDTERNTVLDSGGMGTLYQALTQRQYGKIYVLLGINEIGWDTDYFAGRYEAFLERLRRDEPEAEIYIVSLTPVTREISGTHEYFNMDRVRAYNEALLALAEKTGCWYLDLCRALAGEDGYLPAECAAVDGIHFAQDTYPLLADYLRTHYAGPAVTENAAQ